MTDYREKFLEAEQQALSLVDQLKSLKKEASDYKTASGSLQKTQEKIEALIRDLSSVIEEERNLVKAIKEIGTDKIIEEIEKNRLSLEEVSSNQAQLLSRLFLFIYGIAGLIVIIGILTIVFR